MYPKVGRGEHSLLLNVMDKSYYVMSTICAES